MVGESDTLTKELKFSSSAIGTLYKGRAGREKAIIKEYRSFVSGGTVHSACSMVSRIGAAGGKRHPRLVAAQESIARTVAVMDYIQGVSLKSHLKNKKLSLSDRYALSIEITKGFWELHRVGICGAGINERKMRGH